MFIGCVVLQKALLQGHTVQDLRNKEFWSCERRSLVTNVGFIDQIQRTTLYGHVNKYLLYPSLDSSNRINKNIHFFGGIFICAILDVIYGYK